MVSAIIQMAKTVTQRRSAKDLRALERGVEYWAIKSILDKDKDLICVVLRKSRNGNLIFYSVWKKIRTKKPS